jgi:hypothetical protein
LGLPNIPHVLRPLRLRPGTETDFGHDDCSCPLRHSALGGDLTSTDRSHLLKVERRLKGVSRCASDPSQPSVGQRFTVDNRADRKWNGNAFVIETRVQALYELVFDQVLVDELLRA